MVECLRKRLLRREPVAERIKRRRGTSKELAAQPKESPTIVPEELGVQPTNPKETAALVQRELTVRSSGAVAPNWWTSLKCLSHVSQALLFVVALASYWYAIHPDYTKKLLVLKAAKAKDDLIELEHKRRALNASLLNTTNRLIQQHAQVDETKKLLGSRTAELEAARVRSGTAEARADKAYEAVLNTALNSVLNALNGCGFPRSTANFRIYFQHGGLDRCQPLIQEAMGRHEKNLRREDIELIYRSINRAIAERLPAYRAILASYVDVRQRFQRSGVKEDPLDHDPSSHPSFVYEHSVAYRAIRDLIDQIVQEVEGEVRDAIRKSR